MGNGTLDADDVRTLDRIAAALGPAAVAPVDAGQIQLGIVLDHITRVYGPAPLCMNKAEVRTWRGLEERLTVALCTRPEGHAGGHNYAIGQVQAERIELTWPNTGKAPDNG